MNYGNYNKPSVATISSSNQAHFDHLDKYQTDYSLNYDENRTKKKRRTKLRICKIVSIILTCLLLSIGIILASIFGAIPCKLTTCNINAKCTNYPFYAKCECNYGFNGNGKEYCDECGISFYKSNVRIVGGVPAIPHSWPSAVIILASYKALANLDGDSVLVDTGFSCGGTLINRKTVLTAGHCILTSFEYEYQNKTYLIQAKPNVFYPTLSSIYKVYVGADASVEEGIDIKPAIPMSVSEVILHESYSDETTLNDIAILKLTDLVRLDKNVQLACLPNPKLGPSYPPINITAYAMGWGLIGEDEMPPTMLHNVAFNIYSGELCSQVSLNIPKNWESQICAGEIEGGKDTCQGDSGGSIFILDTINGKAKYISVGIVSYGEGCARAYLPGIE